MTTDQQEEFLEHMRNGMRRGAAANAMGLARKVVLDYISEHEDYETLVLDAEGEATEHVEEALYQAAVSGSVSAAKLWFALRNPGISKEIAVIDSNAEDPMAALMALSGAGTGSDA